MRRSFMLGAAFIGGVGLGTVIAILLVDAYETACPLCGGRLGTEEGYLFCKACGVKLKIEERKA